jgi:hypothetical protein
MVVALSIATASSAPAVTAAAAGEPFLTVSGDVLTVGGRTVVLRGENFNNGPGLSCCNGTDIGGINSTAADYAQVAGMGGNFVRFGLDYRWYATDRARFFSVLDQHLAWAAYAHLWIVPVMFVPPGGSNGGYGGQAGFWGSAGNQDLLTAFWADFAAHYAGNPTMAGYDIFNEPAPPSAAAWNAVAQRITNAIANADPNHLVVLENSSAGWDFPAVSAPRVLWSSHCYAAVGTDGCNYPGASPQAPGRRPFLIGEVGSQRQAGLRYVPANLQSFNSAGVSWAHFMMHGVGFGLMQNWRGGDFSNPWSEMMQVVAGAMSGGVHPAPAPAPPAAAPAPAAPAPDPVVVATPPRLNRGIALRLASPGPRQEEPTVFAPPARFIPASTLLNLVAQGLAALGACVLIALRRRRASWDWSA